MSDTFSPKSNNGTSSSSYTAFAVSAVAGVHPARLAVRDDCRLLLRTTFAPATKSTPASKLIAEAAAITPYDMAFVSPDTTTASVLVDDDVVCGCVVVLGVVVLGVVVGVGFVENRCFTSGFPRLKKVVGVADVVVVVVAVVVSP